MRIFPTTLPGTFVIEATKHSDARGYLIRTYCQNTFATNHLNTNWSQSCITSSPIEGTLRGMHFQTKPHAEIKLIRCITGRVWDCLVDLRPDSPTYLRWESFELSEQNDRSLYVPEGIAHGFLTLTPDVRMLYSMSTPYAPDSVSGVLWNDPALAIVWPKIPIVIAEKDQAWPLL
jgi:dTDP-4-dehydrorhamnose 3,5-epimerase